MLAGEFTLIEAFVWDNIALLGTALGWCYGILGWVANITFLKAPQLSSSHAYGPTAQWFRSSERSYIAEIHSRSRHSPKTNKLLCEELNISCNNHNILREIDLREIAAPSCGSHGIIVQPSTFLLSSPLGSSLSRLHI